MKIKALRSKSEESPLHNKKRIKTKYRVPQALKYLYKKTISSFYFQFTPEKYFIIFFFSFSQYNLLFYTAENIFNRQRTLCRLLAKDALLIKFWTQVAIHTVPCFPYSLIQTKLYTYLHYKERQLALQVCFLSLDWYIPWFCLPQWSHQWCPATVMRAVWKVRRDIGYVQIHSGTNLPLAIWPANGECDLSPVGSIEWQTWVNWVRSFISNEQDNVTQ